MYKRLYIVIHQNLKVDSFNMFDPSVTLAPSIAIFNLSYYDKQNKYSLVIVSKHIH